MSHPVPNLAVSPIYPIAWLLIGVWLAFVIMVMIRGYRRTHRTHVDPPCEAIWILMRRAPLLLDDGAPRSTRSIFRRVVERIRQWIRR